MRQQVGEYLPAFDGLDPAFQNDTNGYFMQSMYCDQTTGMCTVPKCAVKNAASCYNHYKVSACILRVCWRAASAKMGADRGLREITHAYGKPTRPNHLLSTVMSTSGTTHSCLVCGSDQTMDLVGTIGTMLQLR